MAEDALVLPLRSWRLRRFLTQQELADKVGVSNNTVSHWETGVKVPRIRHIRALAEALEVEPGQILFDDPKEHPVAA